MFGRIALASIGVLSISSSLHAADIYSRERASFKDEPVYAAPHIWQGFYIGVNAGYGWSANDHADLEVFGPANEPLYPLSAPYDTEFEGGFGGVQVGYNAQFGRLVLGIEADIQGADFSVGDVQSNPFNIRDFGDSTLTTDFSIDWFGTVRGRLGVSFDRALIYATGGLAYGKVELDGAYSTRFTGDNPVRFGSDDTEIGYAVGGGVEYALGDGWSLKGEYLYVDLGTVSASTAFGEEDYKTEVDTAFHAVRLGLNYTFGSEEAAPLK
jgi:outer membrane immunogenic protein